MWWTSGLWPLCLLVCGLHCLHIDGNQDKISELPRSSDELNCMPSNVMDGTLLKESLDEGYLD